jgi:hypothetical protein
MLFSSSPPPHTYQDESNARLNRQHCYIRTVVCTHSYTSPWPHAIWSQTLYVNRPNPIRNTIVADSHNSFFFTSSLSLVYQHNTHISGCVYCNTKSATLIHTHSCKYTFISITMASRNMVSKIVYQPPQPQPFLIL